MRLQTEGIEDLLHTVSQMGERMEAVVPEMLQAGGNAAKAAMQETAAWADNTGVLRRSIKVSAVKGEGSMRYVDVSPTGTHHGSQTNAQVGFSLEYGRGAHTFKRATSRGRMKRYTVGAMAPRPWIHKAMEDSERIVGAMRAVMEARLNG